MIERKKVVRDLSTKESREFWLRAEETGKEVRKWPAWKRAGINVSLIRRRARGK